MKIQHSLNRVYQPHRALGVSYSKTHLWRRSLTLLSLSLSRLAIMLHYTHSTFFVHYYIYVCPRCIYTHTMFTLFTNVASATYHYYYYSSSQSVDSSVDRLVNPINRSCLQPWISSCWFSLSQLSLCLTLFQSTLCQLFHCQPSGRSVRYSLSTTIDYFWTISSSH